MKPILRAIEHNTHPGEILYNLIIIPNNLTIDESANMLGVTNTKLLDIVNGLAPVNKEMATRISKAFGGNENIWIRLQSAYDKRSVENR